jgi:Kef-type K+ transport system membrane component KefB/nucleotide-binding universal stress UspA family protein
MMNHLLWTFLRRHGCLCSPVLGVAILLHGTGAALAQEGTKGPSEVIFLAELLVLLLVGRLLGEAMQRIGQPSVMGQLLAGIILGPSVLGLVWPDLQHALFPRTPEQKAMIDAISQFGILLLLLLTGMETDLKLVRKVGKAAISISVTGVVVPFACGITLGEFMPEYLLPHPDKRLLTSLFLGTALSISSIKIVAAIVREMGFTRRNLGQVIVASAIMEDTIGWIIIAIIFGLAEVGAIDIFHVSKSVLGTIVFLLASFTIGRRVVFWLIRWVNDNFKSDFSVITTILIVMGAMALTTHFIGVHTVLGAFVAGVLIGESPILSKHIDEQLRGLIVAFFMPVFFGIAGLSADLTILKDTQLLLMAGGLIAIASLGKFAGAFVGGKIGGLTQQESLALACGMNARGSTEVIVATIGLAMGALSQSLFTMIVAMAIVTTMAMPPMLRWALSRVPLGKVENERLVREEFEAKGFVPNLERLLLAVDDGANSKFAAHLAGLIAGPRGLPTTVLPVQLRDKAKKSNSNSANTSITESQEYSTTEVMEQAAEQTRNPQDDETPLSPTDITVRMSQQPTGEAVAREAEKGYDLLFVGIENARKKSGGFHEDLTRIASAFEGPLAVAIARNVHLKRPQACPLNILVPITGTDVSRRAAEIAIAIGLSCKSSLTVLYVSNENSDGARRKRRFRARRQEEAILKDVVELADRYDYEIKTAVETDVAPNKAIAKVAKQHSHDLIVMGVSRRTGDMLDFGNTAAAILEDVDRSILFVSS